MKLLKKIFIIITAPIWFPWKFLFFRKEGRKFQEVDDKTKIFRIIRSFFTKPLKLFIYIFIIILELTCVYKIRYSVITYPLTRLFVHNYYLEENQTAKLLGLKYVQARSLDNYSSDLQIAFSYIDTWDLDSKNKMYAIFNSELMKVFFEYAQPPVINHLITRFNNEENYREGIHKLVKNINKLIPQTVKELTRGGENNEIVQIIGSLTSVSLYALDFNALLDMFGLYAKYDGAIDFPFFTTDFVDALFEIGKKYGEGNSLLTTFEDVCSVYRCGW